VDQGIRDAFVEALKKTVIKFYGTNPRESPYYARIINRPHFDRLHSYMGQGTIIIGGQALAQDLYIAPTLIDNVSATSPVMQEEIFGPILPVLTYCEFPEAIDFINARPKPLALYLFSSDREKQELVRKNTSSGGYCINDALVQLVSPYLPFGGVGDSGTGLYHGKAGFDTFSHMKSMVRNTLGYDIPLRYVPYRFKLGLVKWLF
jgi:aldehyde dehydrogenase (NAD+)